MDRDEAMERVRRCLALGASSNENEARTALLKARELMAKYHIEESEVGKGRDAEIVTVSTPFSFSSRRDPWMEYLVNIVAGHMCCAVFYERYQGKQTREVLIRGFEDDVGPCMSALVLAERAIRDGSKGLNSADRVSYATGFIAGLNAAYWDQNARNAEFGLVMTVPQAVLDSMGDIPESGGYCKLTVTDRVLYDRGLEHGRNHLNPRIPEGAEHETRSRNRFTQHRKEDNSNVCNIIQSNPARYRNQPGHPRGGGRMMDDTTLSRIFFFVTGFAVATVICVIGFAVVSTL